MKTRILFLTLLTSISFFLITNGLAYAERFTGCLKQFNGKLYNLKVGTTPLSSCNIGDIEIWWNQEGPPGQDGLDGADGATGPAGTPGGPQFILKDGNGIQLGTVVTVNDDSESFVDPSVGFVVQNRSVLTALEIEKADTTIATVGISVDRFKIHFQHRLVFENLGCSGTPRIRDNVSKSDFPSAFTMSAVVGEPGQPNVRKLYVPVDEAEVPQPKDIQSILVGNNCISPVSIPSMSTVSAELIDVELHKTHPAEYTLEKP